MREKRETKSKPICVLEPLCGSILVRGPERIQNGRKWQFVRLMQKERREREERKREKPQQSFPPPNIIISIDIHAATRNPQKAAEEYFAYSSLFTAKNF